MKHQLKAEYAAKKKSIRRRLSEFKKIWALGDEEIFAELCFCVCTPQSKAVVCDRAIRTLVGTRVLYTGNEDEIREHLVGVRFPNNKARFIVYDRDLLSKGGKIEIRSRIDGKDVLSSRKWLADNIKGVGYKEASHFLRNIGFGGDLAILDVHILRNMKRLGLVKEIPSNITVQRYAELEARLRCFSRDIGIAMDELDILFWSRETGEIFK
ncbi:MAG: N-glycosylase/DNA lyase [Candidatus Omnitrophica bacterium]|nr:N-glycosylase/DNA lyase [Candidatus Omnitrophota bacterium]MDD5487687.1 N-glycosylase/DNA lyase [Candidatus Omnitrophota bacterium]